MLASGKGLAQPSLAGPGQADADLVLEDQILTLTLGIMASKTGCTMPFLKQWG